MGKQNFGYKLLFIIALGVAIMNAAAHNHLPIIDDYDTPAEDTSAKKTDSTSSKTDSSAVKDTFTVPDTTVKLKFPLYDKTGDPVADYNRPKSMDFPDAKNEKSEFSYDPDSNRYYYSSYFGRQYSRTPTYLSLDEYKKYRGKIDEDAYWRRRLDAMMLFNKKPELPQMYKEGMFDRIFGPGGITVKPQGNVDVTFGGNWQNIKNPTLVQRAQKYGIFDFDMQMNVNLLATVGDKLKLNISNNTKPSFDYQNMQKIDYNGKEDEMIKKIEAGNISFPLKSNLINGVQSLFGLKAQLQFGKLWVTGVISQQKSQRKSITLQGGAQAQQFSIKADAYDENKNFLLAQYFHDNYNKALEKFPIINSQVTITKIQVWVTNRTGTVNGVRDVLCFQDLGEVNPYTEIMKNGAPGIRDGVPDNSSNRLYAQLLVNPTGRQQQYATNNATDIGLKQGQDFERTTARQLSATEYSFNPRIGYITLNTQMNPDDVLGVAYRYTYKGKVYQVGEFAEDLPPDTTNPKVLYLKLLKGTANRPYLPIWDLMMKNVYTLGGMGLTRENFTLNIMYQDPGGGEKRYMPEGAKEGIPFLTLLNLDRLNSQNIESPDGVFDFVEDVTVNLKQGKIIFPVLEPFGSDLSEAIGANGNRVLQRKYIFQQLYDSTKFLAQQFQSVNRYILKGTYKSSTSSEIFLGGFNIPQGSVSVTAGGTRLVENQDYQIDYGLGRIKILNTGILSSGMPINIQYEDNATFGFQQQNFTGARFDYYASGKLTLGATFMRLKERPFTQKVTFGDDPIKNTVIGLDANYQSEVPAVTRLLDKLPIYSTTSPSFLTLSGEVASIIPGHPQQINNLDPEGAVYIDDFEGTTSAYDMRFPAVAWSLASTPYGATNRFNKELFPEAATSNKLTYGMNRAKLAWYSIEPTLVDPGTGVPDYVKNDSNQHYIRSVQIKDVFPNRPAQSLQTTMSTFDLAYYPNERGPYNFDATNIDDSGKLLRPQDRWAGITRSIDNTDFESSNVQYIQFWVMDPFLSWPSGTVPNGGQLYINLGSVSEDVLKDSRLSFENGVPYPFDNSKVDSTVWGYVPRFQQQITRAFDNDPAARAAQDVGYDEMPSDKESRQFKAFLDQLRQRLGATNPAYIKAASDPSNDDYHYFRGADYDQLKLGVLARYKGFNNPEGNSPVTDPNSAFATSATTIPESEDINRDNTLNEAENYYQYRIELNPNNLVVGQNYIINKQITKNVKLPNGQTADETWYQFKIPIREYNGKVGGISDFRSIRFLRMFMSGWQDSTILRFASLELGRSQWRTYNYSLTTPGENQPQQNLNTDFTVTSVSIEENASRTPVNYIIPPGVNRQLTTGSTTGQVIQQNEQSLSLRACALQDGDARAVFKEVNVDMRQFNYLRMFLHAESMVDQSPVKDGDVNAFIRIGSDFTTNYYEYRVPLTITPATISTDPNVVWPAANNVNITLAELVNAKKERDALGVPTYTPYYTKDSKGNTIVIVGNPNIGGAKTMMLGILNPKKSNSTPTDDGMAKCVEVWFDEMRMAGTNDQVGYAAAGKMSLQLADLGSLNMSGSMHTQGYGNIDQKIQQRSQDDFYQYNVSSNLNLGKLMPKNWGVQLPFFIGYTQSASTPKYNPYNQDVKLVDAMSALNDSKKADSLKSAAQDFTSITSFNFTNVRINGKNGKTRMPWSIKNFDFSYSYNNQFKHNALVALDIQNTQRFNVGYTYAIKSKSIEPFKRMIKSKNKWFSPIKDFNFNPLPANFTFRNELYRISQEQRARNLDDGSGYQIPSTFYKFFTWTRTYNMRWELTKSLNFDYTATNVSSIDEPYGRINTKEKRDSLLGRLATFGRNTSFNQTFNSSYTVPLNKLPATDWINLRLGYNATYTWTTAAPIARSLGNTIGNTSTQTITGDMNLTQLYNKSRWLRAINNPRVKTKENNKSKAPSSIDGSGKDKSEVISLVSGDNAPNPQTMKSKGKVIGGGGLAGDIDDVSPPKSEPQAAGGGKGGAANGGGNSTAGGGNAGGGNTGGGNTTGSGAGATGAGGSGNNSGSNAAGGATGGNTSAGGNAGGTKNNNNTGTAGNGNTTKGNTGNGTNNGKGNTNTKGNTGSGSNGSNGATGNNGGTGKTNTGTGNSGNTGTTASGTGNGGGSNTNVFEGLNMADLTDDEIDSLMDVQKRLDKAKAKADRKKRRKERRDKRRARRAKTPTLPEPVRMVGKVLTMVSRISVNYTQTGGTTLPGYMDSTNGMGINRSNLQPGLGFVYGYQPNYTWLEQKGKDGKLTRDSLFNSQFVQTYSQNLSATATLNPIKDLRADLTISKTFSKTHNELFKDTGTGTYHHFNPNEYGSFNISYVTVRTMFKNTSVTSDVYKQFLSNREIISKRLGMSNPYTNGLIDPSNPNYYKGYTQFSQDVLIPSFIAAYTGRGADKQALIDYKHNSVKDNPFKYFIPLPNWKVTYNGLSKLPYISKIFNNFVINHTYTGSMSMNNFNTNLLFNDLFGLGFPSFIDSNSRNYVPFYQVSNVTLAQAFNPLIGIDAALKNNMTFKFELRRSKTQSLSLTDYQVSENTSMEYVVGFGFRKKGLRLPFKVMGVSKLKNELIGKVDIGFRDEKNSNTFLANNISVVSRGQQVIRISPSLDYTASKYLTLRLFFDRQQTIPYVSTSYPTTTTKAGITLRFTFAQ